MILAFLLIVGGSSAQQTPAPAPSGPLSIVGATAHIGNGQVVENSLIIIENGRITSVGSATQGQPQGEVIQAQGHHVYPGFIAPNSTLGLVEIDAVRASDDEDELGDFLPHVRSLIAYNAESKVVESMRPNGVLVGQITPRGGRISGTSSIVQFDAWNWEDAVLYEDDGIHLNWPSSVRRGRWWMGEDPGIKPNKAYQEEIDEMGTFFANARAYVSGPRNQAHLPFAAMEKIFNQQAKLFVHADGEREIIDLLNFVDAQALKNVVLVGGANAHKVAPQLVQRNIPVLVGRVHNRPAQADDDYDQPYKLAHLLHEAGVLVGLESSGSMERMNTRNLPFYAGTVVAHGADKEEALQMITSNTAQILGIDDRLGTLEEGKEATLFISQGDALDMRTNKITRAFIQGRDISLETHQTELARRYSEKFGHQQE